MFKIVIVISIDTVVIYRIHGIYTTYLHICMSSIGEAQKIDRFVEAFVKTFWQDNSGTSHCPFKHPDTAHMLAYSIIMLNTDLHRANLDKKKNKKKMTLEEFIKNLRKIDKDKDNKNDNGSDIDRDYLSRIYNNISYKAIVLATTSSNDHHNNSNNSSSSSSHDNSNSNNYNHDINKSNSGEILLTQDSMYNVDSNNIYTKNNILTNEQIIKEEKNFIFEMCRSIRHSEDLLRSLAPFTFKFNMTNIDTKMSLDLVSFMFESVWLHFHSVSESLLNNFNSNTTDLSIKSIALDILHHSLTSAIFLNLKVESLTLADTLNNFKIYCENLPNHSSSNNNSFDNSWYTDIELSLPSMISDTTSKVHLLIMYLKNIISNEDNNYEKLKHISVKIDKKAKILEQNYFFVLDGDLYKVNRTGKSDLYHFFLFSHQLIYAHYYKNEYKVHEQLSLLHMNVTDICNTSTSTTNNNDNNDITQCSLYIEHPTKSFTIIAETIELKLKWLQALKQTIENCQNKLQIKQNNNNINNIVEDGIFDESRISTSSTSSNNNRLNDSISNDLKGNKNRHSSMAKSPLRRTSSWRIS